MFKFDSRSLLPAGNLMFCSGYVGAFLEKRWLLIEVPSWEKKRSPLPSHTHYLLGVSQT